MEETVNFDLDIRDALEESHWECYKKCIAALSSLSYARVALPTHANADGDAIASQACEAETLRVLLPNTEVDPAFITVGGVRHPQNIAMLKIGNMSTQDTMPRHYDFCFLLDAASPSQTNVRLEGVKADIALDPGHEAGTDEDATLLGGHARATATISFIHYLLARMEAEHIASPLDVTDIPPTLAALVYFGINQDTAGCSTSDTTEFDRLIRKLAFLRADDDAMLRIENYPIPRAHRQLTARGLSEKHVFEAGSLAVSSLGYIQPGQEDIVSIVAEDLSREEWVQKAIAIGIVLGEGRDPSIKASLRTSLDTTDAVSDIRKLIGPTSGGSRGSVAGTADLGYRGNLIQLASDDNERRGPQTLVLARLFLELLSQWRDNNAIPEMFQPLDEALRHNRQQFGQRKERELNDIIDWFCQRQQEWSTKRKKAARGGDPEFPSPEEELAEMFREASERREGSESEILENLIHRQINRRARTIFQEE